MQLDIGAEHCVLHFKLSMLSDTLLSRQSCALAQVTRIDGAQPEPLTAASLAAHTRNSHWAEEFRAQACGHPAPLPTSMSRSCAQ